MSKEIVIMHDELTEERRRRRELSGIVRHWQRFAGQLGKKLGCAAIDEEILKAVDALVKVVPKNTTKPLVWKTNTRKKFPHIRKYLKEHCAVDLTDEQIRYIARKLPKSVREEIMDDCTDTQPRDWFIDVLVQVIMGPENHWPVNMDKGSDYDNQFPQRYTEACKRHSIRMVFK